MHRFTLSFSTEGLADWFATIFDHGITKRGFSPMASVTGGWSADDHRWNVGQQIIDDHFEVRLLNLNNVPAIDVAGGLLNWLQANCEVFYTSYLVEGYRIIEFRLKPEKSTIMAMVADRRALASERLVEPYQEVASGPAAAAQ